jgi:pyrroline-5-carboxylate reductase
MTLPVIAIIGAGHMGRSLIGGLIKHGHPPRTLWASDPSTEALRHLQQTFQIQTTQENKQAVSVADVLIFAIKPQNFAAVATELSPALTARKPLIISVAAGIREDHIQEWLGNRSMAIVRTMPNTPALIKCGATGLHANPFVSPEQRHIAESILGAVGITVWLEDEGLLDTVTALSGSGTAYFFHMMESLQLGAEEMGLPTKTARLLTLQTALGAARMALESNTSLAELARQAMSPGGTTEKAISVLEKHNIRLHYKEAMQAAKSRAEELAILFGEKK